MTTTWRRHLLGVVATVALTALVATACSDDPAAAPSTTAPTATSPTATSPTATGVPPSESPDPDAALERGADHAAAQLANIDIASLSMFAYLHRNWGLEGLSDAAPLAAARAGSAQLDPEEANLRRLVDGTSGVPDGPPPSERTTQVLTRALQCDRTPLGTQELEAARALVDGGGYDTTHAALAVGWMDELACDPATVAELRDRTVQRLLVEFDPGGAVTDLALEQSATLHYLGAGDAVTDEWVRATLAAQRDDGGWGERQSTWHMTLLALWTLLASQGPGADAPMVPPA